LLINLSPEEKRRAAVSLRPFTIKVLEEIGFGRKLLRDIPKPSSKNGGLLLVRIG
jgi:hypothetical protein